MSHVNDDSAAPEARPSRGRGGRPRLYESPAERQKAYQRRVRLKAAAFDALQQQAGEGLTPNPRSGKPQTGRELLAALQAGGFIGMWADRDDIGDSVEYARQLRERAWSRRHS
jgi:hypothetical protein